MCLQFIKQIQGSHSVKSSLPFLVHNYLEFRVKEMIRYIVVVGLLTFWIKTVERVQNMVYIKDPIIDSWTD